LANKLVILGGGESGTGAALLAKKKGWEVFLSDSGSLKSSYRAELKEAGIRFEEGKHTEEEVLGAHTIVKSPGISPKVPMVKKCAEAGIPIISEIEFASRYSNAFMIGITGTNGKTTTSLLTHHILKQAGLKVALAGNVGTSMARQLLVSDPDYWVLEISSFQLDDCYDLRLNIAVLLNITPDHLDRYVTMENYVASKFRITQNQQAEDVFLWCADDPVSAEAFKIRESDLNQRIMTFSLEKQAVEGAYVSGTAFKVLINQPKTEFNMEINQLTISGKHNTYNSMAAAVIANVLMIRKELIRESLSDFKNVEHRLEFVARIKGVDYINDSKATNVNSAWYALESMPDGIIWIAGGVDKGNDYDMLKPLVKQKVRVIICLGENNIRLHHAFQSEVDMIVNTSSAKEAVKMAYELSRKDETVLLSPACASFDLFENYEERGRLFKEAVRSL
jgi:UDP-N-acetylmuramoylalanine--D-glutamate ligase